MSQPQTQPNSKAPLLPSEKSQALNAMIRVTQGMVQITEREAQALAQNDLTTFAIIQDEKAFMAEHYQRASSEFRSNVHRYRGVDKTLLARLEALQVDLAERTHSNNAMVTTLYERSRANTQTTLLAAQEMAQKTHVRFPASGNN